MKILVVDDEVLGRERLLRLLRKLQPDAQCLEAESGEEALALAGQHAPDLLLLDIRMPGMDGIDVAAHLDTLERPPAVIFCTAYDQYALEALQHQAVAYLLKPVREQELSRALANAGRVNRLQLASLRPDSSETGQSRSQVSSQTHRGLETMAIADIRFFLAEQKYVTACSPTAQLLIPDTLKDLEREFDQQFLRVHRNALVALEHIVRLQRDDSGAWQVVLDGVEERPAVSRRHLAQVKQRLVERC
ncbi:MAG: DNA-binding response regulator [Gammaproteobacteria bacterium]|nr:MAG: DNA-binding response regulator [Gammaproteobacteria bacterium]RLA59905.1 MAG: DNA-binding response regulator [Gammaproteobacteria bacterium]